MSTATNVSAAKPAAGGAIYVAPVGTTLPTDATTALNAAFKSLGYVSEDGTTNASNMDTEVIRAWGKDPVLTLYNDREDTFKFNLIEVLNVDVLKLVYGDSNVTGALATGITVEVNGGALAEHSIVIDMIMRNGALKRVVIPSASVTSVGEITYSDSAAVGYDTTVTCMADSDGNYHYEYIVRA